MPRTAYGNTHSLNGWPMVNGDECEWVTIPGTSNVSLQIQRGQPTAILRAFVADWNAYIEPVYDADSACWTPTNSVPTSDHLSGTACDVRWNSHPFQVSYAGFTPQMIATMREMLDFYEGTVFWGQDWTSPKDPMHISLNGDAYGGPSTYHNPATQSFIDRKIRSDGYSTFRRGATQAQPKVLTVPLMSIGGGRWTSPSPAWGHLIMRESSGDPTIVQQIIDVNSGGNEAEGLFQIAGCVPLDTEILTRRGVLRHDEVQVGDLTVGYDPQTGRSQWTRIVRVMHYDSGEIFRIGRGKWQAEATADHRWATFRPAREESLTSCPECGWAGNPRTGSPPTGRSVSTHRGRAHGSKHSTPDYKGKFEMVESASLKQYHSILLAAPARTGLDLPISEQEAAILGWILSDGHIRKASEDTYRGPKSYAAWIYQSKPLQVATLEALLADVPHTQSSRQRGMATMPQHEFRLRTPWVTELVKRAELDIDNPVGFVLRLSEHQRTAFLNAVIAAEGCSEDGLTRIAQVDGPMQDAIAIAVYLSGYHPSFNRINAVSTNVSANPKPIGHIGMTRPYRSTGGSARRRHKGYPAMATTGRREPVWCVETELGTWTMRQGKRIMLTGNSTWRAHGGTEFAPTARLATPHQQALIAAKIFLRNPTGSDWGAGLPGREDPNELAAGLVPVDLAPPPQEDELSAEAERMIRELHAALLAPQPSRSALRTPGEPTTFTVPELVRNIDGLLHPIAVDQRSKLGDPREIRRLHDVADTPDPTRAEDATMAATMLSRLTEESPHPTNQAQVQANYTQTTQPPVSVVPVAASPTNTAPPSPSTGTLIGNAYDALEALRLSSTLPPETNAPLEALISVLKTYPTEGSN